MLEEAVMMSVTFSTPQFPQLVFDSRKKEMNRENKTVITNVIWCLLGCFSCDSWQMWCFWNSLTSSFLSPTWTINSRIWQGHRVVKRMDSRVKLTNIPCVTRASYLISLRLEVLIYKSRMMVDNCNTNVCDACEMLNSVPKLDTWHFVLSVISIITKFWDPGEGRSPCDLMLDRKSVV